MVEVRGLRRQRGYLVAGYALGAALSALFSGGSSAAQTAQNKSSARSQMRFQERMASTQYSRSMEDMRRAGLNPMLAYDNGGNAAPMGAGFSSADASGTVSSALQALRLKKELEVMDASIAQMQSQADKAQSDVNVNQEVVKEVQSRVKNIDTSTALDQAQLPRARNLENVEKGMFGKVMSYVDRLMGAFGLGSKAVRGASK